MLIIEEIGMINQSFLFKKLYGKKFKDTNKAVMPGFRSRIYGDLACSFCYRQYVATQIRL